MTDPVDSVISRILVKLVHAKNGHCASFGSEKHRFELNPPAPEEELALFEQKHEIRLPEDYRRFLMVAGNGGAGPYYGILPLERWNIVIPADVTNVLARPSPLRPGLNPNVSLDETLGCAWEELFQGALAVNEQGDSYYGLLVVTGQYRGRIVYVDADGSGIPYFVGHHDFLSWYERWLNELLAGWDVSAFGFGHPGTEKELRDIVAHSTDPLLRDEAMRSLRRIPQN